MDPDPGLYVLLMDADPDPDPTSLFTDFNNDQHNFFHFFLLSYPQAHYLQS